MTSSSPNKAHTLKEKEPIDLEMVHQTIEELRAGKIDSAKLADVLVYLMQERSPQPGESTKEKIVAVQSDVQDVLSAPPSEEEMLKRLEILNNSTNEYVESELLKERNPHIRARILSAYLQKLALPGTIEYDDTTKYYTYMGEHMIPLVCNIDQHNSISLKRCGSDECFSLKFNGNYTCSHMLAILCYFESILGDTEGLAPEHMDTPFVPYDDDGYDLFKFDAKGSNLFMSDDLILTGSDKKNDLINLYREEKLRDSIVSYLNNQWLGMQENNRKLQ